MADYLLSSAAKEDLIRMHHYGVHKFVMQQADSYFNSFFEYFKIIAQRPYSFEAVEFIKPGYRRCVCGSDSMYYCINKTKNKVEIMTIIGRQDLKNMS